MRIRFHHVFMTVVTAVLLASCATSAPYAGRASGPSQQKVLTVELFDSRPVTDDGGQASVPVSALPIPPGQDLLPGQGRTSGVSMNAAAGAAQDPRSPDVSVAAQAAPMVVAPRQGTVLPLPAVSADLPSGSAVVVGLSVPSAPRATGGYPLAQPAAPASAPAARSSAPPAKPAAAPAQQKAAPAAQQSPASSAPQQAAAAPAQRAAAQAASPSGTSQGRGGASPAAAPSGAAAAPSSSQAATQPAASYGRLREIYARVGDQMTINLDGAGFLFLGLPDKQANGMSFKSKEISNGKTSFTFQALQLGTYDLDFLQQDNTTGQSTKETVRVHVVNDQDFSAAVSEQPSADAAPAEETGDPAFAGKLTGLGAYEAAVAELLKGYKDGNPALNDQIAGLYMLMGSYDAAGKYYQKNLPLSSPFTNAAVIGLVRVAAAQKDQTGLMAQLKRFLAMQDPNMEEPLIQAARMERDAGQVGVGLDLAAEYVTRFPQGQWRDEAEFIAAQFLEADSQFRDIARARDLYRDIVAAYPLGDFAGPARDRLQYIERHFYQIR